MNYKKYNFKEAITLFSNSFFIIAFSFLLIRIVEFSWFQFSLHQYTPWQLLFSKSVNLDIQYLGFISLFGLMISLSLRIINRKVSKLFNVLLGIILIFIQICLTQFHITNQTLLSSVLFQFSIQELYSIVLAEFVQSKLTIYLIWLLILSSSTYLLNKLNHNRTIKKKAYLLYIPFLLLVANSLLNINYTYQPIAKFKSIPQFLLANSKPIFLYKSYTSENSELNSFIEIKKSIKEYQTTDNTKTYLNLEYPLIYRTNEKNVLAPFFKKTQTPPNIVLIISESLSTSYSVSATGLNGMSLTPFTDSLAAHGLYWSKFLSNSPRSFGALPNILASLPPSKNSRGLINRKIKGNITYPDHQSLIGILNNNDYYTSYYNPGWGDFDHTKSFMLNMDVDHFIEESDFDSLNYPRYGTWGYSDYELFRRGLDHLDEIENTTPQFSIFQTVAFHSPYDMVAPKYYEKEYVKSKLKSLNLTGNEKGLSKLYNQQFASIFASDEALRYLFNRIKSSDSFNNTIFIITGDHGTGIRLTDNILYKFHVPLIIYSPLLKESKTFNGICSHIDITPSLMALLKNNFNIKSQENAHWLGHGLDTSSVFVSNNSFPLQLDGITRPSYLHKEHIILDNNVYQLKSDFSIKIESDTKQSNLVKRHFKLFNNLNAYTVDENKIWNNKY